MFTCWLRWVGGDWRKNRLRLCNVDSSLWHLELGIFRTEIRKRKINWARLPSILCLISCVRQTSFFLLSLSETRAWEHSYYVKKKNYWRTIVVLVTDASLNYPTGDFKLERGTMWKWNSCSYYFWDTEIRGIRSFALLLKFKSAELEKQIFTGFLLWKQIPSFLEREHEFRFLAVSCIVI